MKNIFQNQIGIILSFCALLLQGILPPKVLSHPGRTDGSGCHNNRRTGDYHCHNSGGSNDSSGTSTPSYIPDIQESYTPEPETIPTPVCYKATKTILTGELWKKNIDSLPWATGEIQKMETVEASLLGKPGKLIVYSIGDVEVKKFFPDDKSVSKYKIENQNWGWVSIINYLEQGTNKAFYLDKNVDEIDREIITSSKKIEEICK